VHGQFERCAMDHSQILRRSMVDVDSALTERETKKLNLTIHL
jgi:hypothetical protein